MRAYPGDAVIKPMCHLTKTALADRVERHLHLGSDLCSEGVGAFRAMEIGFGVDPLLQPSISFIEFRSQKLEKKKMNCCSDVMKPIETSSCCTPQDTAAHAARAMRDSGCGCAPVVEDTENLKLVGVVTERDVCCGVAADDRRASEVRVEEIMRPLSACCGADEPVEEARRKLHEHRATSLPVADSAGGCCGTVSAHRLEKS